jgi:hypothetical protein
MRSPTRQRVMGIIFILFALFIWGFFARSVTTDQVASFGLAPGGVASQLPPWQVPALATLYGLAVVTAILGGIQLARGFERWTNWCCRLCGLFRVLLLVWATAGKC